MDYRKVGHAMRRRMGGTPGAAYEAAAAPKDIAAAIQASQQYSGPDPTTRIEDWKASEAK